MTGDRCPECGLAVDRDVLRASAIPWSHRRRVGRVRAYLKTARLFTSGHKSLRDEQLRAQHLADASAFARVTGVILGLLAAACWFAVAFVSEGRVYALLALRAYDGSPKRPGWLDDLLVPWSAGMLIPWVIPAGAFLFGYHLGTVQRTVFRARGRSADVRHTAVALGSYAGAPLLLLVPTAIVLGATIAIDSRAETAAVWRSQPVRMLALVLLALGAVLLLITIFGTFLRVGLWVVRSTDARLPRALLAVGELILLWAAGAVLFLFALPWAAGFVRLWVRSFG
ncbi:MAG: hypothetical protein ACAI43_10525 [Phycisphaerae bacterium]